MAIIENFEKAYGSDMINKIVKNSVAEIGDGKTIPDTTRKELIAFMLYLERIKIKCSLAGSAVHGALLKDSDLDLKVSFPKHLKGGAEQSGDRLLYPYAMLKLLENIQKMGYRNSTYRNSRYNFIDLVLPSGGNVEISNKEEFETFKGSNWSPDKIVPGGYDEFLFTTNYNLSPTHRQFMLIGKYVGRCVRIQQVRFANGEEYSVGINSMSICFLFTGIMRHYKKDYPENVDNMAKLLDYTLEWLGKMEQAFCELTMNEMGYFESIPTGTDTGAEDTQKCGHRRGFRLHVTVESNKNYRQWNIAENSIQENLTYLIKSLHAYYKSRCS